MRHGHSLMLATLADESFTEAARGALERQGETYTIEEQGDGRQRCRDAAQAKAVSLGDS